MGSKALQTTENLQSEKNSFHLGNFYSMLSANRFLPEFALQRRKMLETGLRKKSEKDNNIIGIVDISLIAK